MVFVLDRFGKPLMPCSEKRARLLLDRGRARIHRLVPFVIRLIDRQVTTCTLQPLRIKLDPGSKMTGMAITRDAEKQVAAVINLFELVHRGRQISEALTARRAMRRRRRGQLRFRAPRFMNRGNQKPGWLAPSLRHRIETTMAWVARFRRWAPITALSTELVRFDLQQLEQPEISGIQYQQGTLAGYEVREYVLEKWGRRCAYCGVEHTPLQLEHIVAKANGGTDRVSNLTLACGACNQKKAAKPIEVFLAKKPDVLKRILAQVKRPLKDAAAVNSTRKALVKALEATGLPVETASGGRTKYNRQRLSIPKTHALDAVCVGEVSTVTGWKKPTLTIKCMGRGSYQRTRLDAFGFPRGYLASQKSFFGFRTGDLVLATVAKGKKVGSYTGRVAVRKTGSFNIQTCTAVVQGIGHANCRLLQRGDGYQYHFTERMSHSSPG